MSEPKKFGSFGGVYTPSLLTILGVIMYLRMGWVVGNAGLYATLMIIFVAHIISVSTGLSISSISTDKKIKAGGIYYILSRSLGLPIGGAIGLTLFVGTALSIALYLVGFASSFNSYFGLGADDINSIRITGSVALFIIAVIAFISTSSAIKTQYIILTLIGLSLISIFFGSGHTPEVPPVVEELPEIKWFEIFAIFFPAVTGFTAGVAMSGDLKDPKKAIPSGTIAAIATGLVVYVGLAFFLHFNVDAYALKTDYDILKKIAWIPILVVLGIWGATLSSALGGILGAPRILQAMSLDRITPKVFGKGVGAANEPRNALILTFVLAEAGILIGQLDVIAEVVSMFYLAAYGFINLSAFLESWASTDFRPTLKIPKFIPIIGFISTFYIMMMLNMAAMVVSMLLIGGVFIYLTRRQIQIGSGDVWHSVWSSIVRTGLKKIEQKEAHTRHWNPNMLVFSAEEKHNDSLAKLAKNLSGKQGMVSFFELQEDQEASVLFPNAAEKSAAQQDHNIFWRKQTCQNFHEGLGTIAATYGFSGVEPNTILLEVQEESIDQQAFQAMDKQLKSLDFNVILSRLQRGTSFNEFKQIDVWWSQEEQHAELTLNLLKFISDAEDWRNASIRLLYVNNARQTKEHIEGKIRHLLDGFRVDCSIEIVHNRIEQNPLHDIIKVLSNQADLVIAAIPSALEDLKHYTALPYSFAFVRASEELNKTKIHVEDNKETRAVGTVQVEQKELEAIHTSGYPEFQLLVEKIDEELQQHISSFDQTFLTPYLNQLNGFAEQIKEEAFEKGEEIHPGLLQERLLSSILQQWESHENSFEQLHERFQQALSSHLLQLEHLRMKLPVNLKRKFTKQEIAQFKPQTRAERRSKNWLRMKRLWGAQAPSIRFDFHELFELYLNAHYIPDLYRYMHQVGITYYEFQEVLKKPLFNALKKEQLGLNDLQNIGQELTTAVQQVLSNTKQLFPHVGRSFVNTLHQAINRMDVNYHIESFNQTGQAKRNKGILANFPNHWKRNQELIANQFRVDYLLAGITLKIKGINTHLINTFSTRYLNELQENFEFFLGRLEQAGSTFDWEQETEKSEITLPETSVFVQQAVAVLDEVLREIPEELQLMDESSLNNISSRQDDRVQTIQLKLFKLCDFHIESHYLGPITKQLREIANTLTQLQKQFANTQRLMRFSAQEEGELNVKADGHASLKEQAVKQMQQLLHELEVLPGKFKHVVETSANDLNEKLQATTFIRQVHNLEHYLDKTERKRSIQQVVEQGQRRFTNAFKKVARIIRLQQKQLAQAQFRVENPVELNPKARVREELEKISLNPKIEAEIPFYYKQLFLGRHFENTSQLRNRSYELEKVNAVQQRFSTGVSRSILVTGEPLSGKSYFSENIAHQYSGQKVYKISPLEGGNHDLTAFFQAVNKTVVSYRVEQNGLGMMPPSCFVFHDVEMWWNRSLDGYAVLEQLISWISKFSDKHTFIVNLNVHTFRLLDRMHKFGEHFSSCIQLSPLDKETLEATLMERHLATGCSFEIQGRGEQKKLNKKFFFSMHQQTEGNIGYAFLHWMACIQRFEEDHIKFKLPEVTRSLKLSNTQLELLTRVVLHKQLGPKRLAEATNEEKEQLTFLVQSGLLRKHRSGTLRVNEFAYPLLMKTLKKGGYLK